MRRDRSFRESLAQAAFSCRLLRAISLASRALTSEWSFKPAFTESVDNFVTINPNGRVRAFLFFSHFFLFIFHAISIRNFPLIFAFIIDLISLSPSPA